MGNVKKRSMERLIATFKKQVDEAAMKGRLLEFMQEVVNGDGTPVTEEIIRRFMRMPDLLNANRLATDNEASMLLAFTGWNHAYAKLQADYDELGDDLTAVLSELERRDDAVAKNKEDDDFWARTASPEHRAAWGVDADVKGGR